MAKGSALAARALLVAHATLAARWLALPGVLYWVSRSVSVTVQLGGWLCGWSLMVLTADLAVAACISASHSTRLFAAAAAGAAIVALSTLLALGAPLVGPELALLPGSVALVAALACRRGRRPVGLYAAWGVLESCVGAGFGHTLLWALSQLLSDESGALEEAWEPVWVFLQINVVLSWLSLLLQLVVFTSLRALARNDGTSTPCSVEASFAEPDSEFLGRSPQLRKRSRRIGLSLGTGLVAAYASVLAACATGYLWFLFHSMGAAYADGSPPPPCGSCYCRRAFASFAATEDVPYGRAQDPLTGATVELRMDIYRGASAVGAAAAGARPLAPAVLFIHGGGFHEGDKRHSVLLDEARELARHGFVTFSLNYRLLGRVGLPQTGAVRDAVEDLRAAVRFVAAHAQELGVDRHRVAVWGSSAGAITAASLSFADERESSGNDGQPSNITAAVGISGSVWPFLVRDARLRGRIGKLVPWFDIHGTSDSIVPFFLAKMTHLYLQFLGLPPESNRLVAVPGAGHVPWRPHGGNWNCTAGAQPCATLRPHVYAFLSHAMRLEGLACPAGGAYAA